MIDPNANLVKERVIAAADNILSGFVWSFTPQGFDYWQQVYNNLKSLAESVPHE